MLLNEVKPESMIKLEFAETHKSYEVNARVLGTAPDGIYVPCFSYNGNPLDPSVFTSKGFSFNLFCMDDNGQWIGWSNVNVELKKHQGKDCYHIWTGNFNSLARSADRRGHERIPVDQHGTLSAKEVVGTKHIMIKDISDNGIAFITPEPLDILQSACQIRFSEQVNKQDYELCVECKCVRTQKIDAGFLYGCAVMKSNRDVLSYIFLKKILAKKEKEEKEEAANKAAGKADK